MAPSAPQVMKTIKSWRLLLPSKTKPLSEPKIIVSKTGLCQNRQTEINAMTPKIRPRANKISNRLPRVALHEFVPLEIDSIPSMFSHALAFEWVIVAPAWSQSPRIFPATDAVVGVHISFVRNCAKKSSKTPRCSFPLPRHCCVAHPLRVR